MATFSLAGESFETVSPSGLTFAEARAYEKETGYVFADLLRGTRPPTGSAATTQALMWIAMKRVKPEMKFSDLDGLSLADIEVGDEDAADESDGEETQDPTPGEDSQPSG